VRWGVVAAAAGIAVAVVVVVVVRADHVAEPPPGPVAKIIATSARTSIVTALLDGGTVVGNDSADTAPEQPWVYRAGVRRPLSAPSAGGHVDVVSPAGYAGGHTPGAASSVAVRWRLADGSAQYLSDRFSFVRALNARGDAVVTFQATVGVHPLAGPLSSLGRGSGGLGLTAQGRTLVFREPPARAGAYLAGASSVSRLATGLGANDCYLPVNDAGYLVYQANWQTEPVTPRPAQLRAPDGTVHDTGLFVDCQQRLLSADGQVVGLLGDVVGLAVGTARIGRWSQGRLTDLGLPADAISAWPCAVNDAGEALVSYFTRAEPQRPRIAVRRKGTWTELPIPASPADPALSVTGVGLNDTGQATGYYQTRSNVVRSVLWQL
jgi:hypothetical protein